MIVDYLNKDNSIVIIYKYIVIIYLYYNNIFPGSRLDQQNWSIDKKAAFKEPILKLLYYHYNLTIFLINIVKCVL